MKQHIEVYHHQNTILSDIYLLKTKYLEQITDENHQEVRNLLNKLKYLQFEHGLNVKDIHKNKTEVKQALLSQDNDKYIEDVRHMLQKQIETNTHSNIQQLVHLRQALQKSRVKVKQTFEQYLNKVVVQYLENLEQIKTTLLLNKKVRVHEVTERYHLHIFNINRNHAELYQDMKSYYQNITKDNLGLIQNLKQQIKHIKEKNHHYALYMKEVLEENRNISIPANEAKQSLKELRSKLKNKEKDLLGYKNNRARLSQLDKHLQNTTKRVEQVKTKLEIVQSDYRNLKQVFEKAVKKVILSNEQQRQKLEQQVLEAKDKQEN